MHINAARGFCLAIAMLAMITSAYSNRIDSLRTDKDVLDFLRSVNADFRNPRFNDIQLKDDATLRKDLACKGMAEAWELKNWVKTDLDGNGLTDLLVMLYWYDYGVYTVLDKSNGKFEFTSLSKNNSDKCEMAKAISLNNKPFLLYYLNGKIDTLVYKMGGFIEKKNTLTDKQIDTIMFRTGYCFGSCPVFSIKMDNSGNAVYEAKTYNPRQGNFTGTIDPEQLREITELINYSDIPSMKDKYAVSWTDDQTAWLTIRYKDGTVKEIKDYGLQGNFALRLLYSKFFDLRTSQEWK